MSSSALGFLNGVEDEIDIGTLALSSPASPSPASSSRRPSPLALRPPSPQRSPSHSIADSNTPTSPIIGRSRTLPRSRQPSAQWSPQGRPNAKLEDLFMESDKVATTNRWILGLVIVNFDLELGPVVDSTYPPLWLSTTEAENIAFSSFPDSLQFDQGSQAHSFRVRACAPSDEPRAPPNAFTRPTCEDGFIYGFSHFTQEKDARSKRGYLQRSLVILTHLPYPSLFSALVSTLGPLYHAHGAPMLEAACHNIANWCAPTPGASVELGFLGSVLQVRLPDGPDELQPADLPVPTTPGSDPVLHITATLAPTAPPILTLLEASLSHLWSLWECLVLCEPILVFAPSPAMTSIAVWWLRDLLRPIPLAADFRPYFTIHDRDHARLSNKLPPRPGLILGVTNPFFARECAHWPHVLSLGRADAGKHSGASGKSPKGMAGPPPGWTTKTHKRHISKDRALLARLEDAVRSRSPGVQAEASRALREHFSGRTAALLVPLNRYLNTLLPAPPTRSAVSAAPPPPSTAALASASFTSFTSLASGASTSFASGPSAAPSPMPSPTPLAATAPAGYAPAPAGPARLKPFSTPAFLASLSAPGAAAPLPFKSSARRREFYARWVRSPAFALWLARQEEVVRATF